LKDAGRKTTGGERGENGNGAGAELRRGGRQGKNIVTRQADMVLKKIGMHYKKGTGDQQKKSRARGGKKIGKS